MIQRYVIANWKLNMGVNDIKNWLDEWQGLATQNVNILIAPSSIHLYPTREYLNELNIKNVTLCAQDTSIYEAGAHTGEIAIGHIAEVCKYCIVGHSESRATKEETLKKAALCKQQNITPIICFQDPIKCTEYYIDDCILAWEDSNNISKNGEYFAKDPKIIEQGISHMKTLLPTNTPVLYGGSVNENNVVQLSSIVALDGVLIGNASLKVTTFYEICKHLQK